MSNAARLAMAIASVTLTLSAQPAAADLELVEDPLSHEVTVVGATAEQQAMVDGAISLYEAAALPIPALTIVFHKYSEGCDGYLGYYDQATTTLDMCNWGQHYKVTAEDTLLHELGHAWSFEHMSSADRGAFVNHRDLAHWHGGDVWWHMGQEQAAEIVAWGVSGGMLNSQYLDEADCSELADAYLVLTGETIGDRCDDGPETPNGNSSVNWRGTPQAECEIGTTYAYCWRGMPRLSGCFFEIRRVHDMLLAAVKSRYQVKPYASAAPKSSRVAGTAGRTPGD